MKSGRSERAGVILKVVHVFLILALGFTSISCNQPPPIELDKRVSEFARDRNTEELGKLNAWFYQASKEKTEHLLLALAKHFELDK